MSEEGLGTLTSALYDELRRLAHGQMRDERSGHTLQTTALVHEAYLRLAGSGVEPGNRAQFLSLAARTMRRVLIDHARAESAAKRGSRAVNLSLDEAGHVPDGAPIDAVEVLALDLALGNLARVDARKAHLLELHVFGGLTYDELAEAAEVSAATVHRDLRMAKAWLRRELSTAPPAEV